MRRTRKWEHVKQEAQRLRALKLTPKEIAQRLGLAKSTVTRWIAAGKFDGEPEIDPTERRAIIAAVHGKTPSEWSKAVRESYDLDATDEQLVDLGETSLLIARDPATPPQLRIQAMGAFRANVKQLNLVARAADERRDAPPERKTFDPPRRTGTDPRGILSGVK